MPLLRHQESAFLKTPNFVGVLRALDVQLDLDVTMHQTIPVTLGMVVLIVVASAYGRGSLLQIP
jgi:hypothetical protein